jgi:hypothetical protein
LLRIKVKCEEAESKDEKMERAAEVKKKPKVKREEGYGDENSLKCVSLGEP